MLRPIGSRLSSLAIGFLLYLSASGNGAVFAQSDANGVRLIQLQFVATKVRSLLDKSVVVVSSDRDTKVQRRASQGDNVFSTIPLDHSVSDISISKGQHFICFAGPVTQRVLLIQLLIKTRGLVGSHCKSSEPRQWFGFQSGSQHWLR